MRSVVRQRHRRPEPGSETRTRQPRPTGLRESRCRAVASIDRLGAAGRAVQGLGSSPRRSPDLCAYPRLRSAHQEIDHRPVDRRTRSGSCRPDGRDNRSASRRASRTCRNHRAATTCPKAGLTTTGRISLSISLSTPVSNRPAARNSSMISVTRKKIRHEKSLSAQLQDVKRQEREPQTDRHHRDILRRRRHVPTGRSRRRTGTPPSRCLRARSRAPRAPRCPTSWRSCVLFCSEASMSRLSVRPWRFIHSTICTISTQATSSHGGLEVILRIAPTALP